MSRHSDESRQEELYDKIIGLGEKSIRKSYYPQLRQKLSELETTNRKLEKEIVDRRLKEEEIKRNYEHQRIVNTLLKVSLKQLPLDELYQITIDTILSLSWITREATLSIYHTEDDPNVLVLKKRHGTPFSMHVACETIPFGHCICGGSAASGKIEFTSHLDEGPNPARFPDGPHTHYSVPIRLEDITIGIICIYLPESHIYHHHEEEILAAIATTLAGIIQRNRMADETARLEQQLRQTQKMEAIGALSGGIAHDFNNLLSPILGYSELALEELTEDSAVAADIREVIKAANLAKELVMQILTLSRQSRHERKPLKIHLLINETLKLLRSTIPTTIDIKNSIEMSDQTVFADPTHIHQVIMNLCTNAYHAMKETGGTLALSLKSITIDTSSDYSNLSALEITPGDYQVLEVSDTGKGMDRLTTEKIFDPYFTTKSKEEGTGLGLSVVHGIVKSYEGHIAVYSEPGQGSTFRVFFPCTSSGDTENLKIDLKTQLPRGAEHILVVDDEPPIADMVTMMLENRGYSVTTCTSSNDALTIFRQHPDLFSLVITDMTMPYMTGLELANQLRAITPEIPLIVCTGFSELINEAKAKAYGFKRYLMKPIIMKDLCIVVREVLDETSASPSTTPPDS